MNIVIDQLPADSWKEFRALRLEALKTDPQAFGSTHQEEAAMNEQFWQSGMRNIWFAQTNQKVIGMIGFLQDISLPGKHRAHMISFWIKPEYRGKGLGKKLVQHIQELAPSRGIKKFYLHVTVTQDAAIKLYESLNFRIVGVLKGNTYSGNQYLDQLLMEWHT